MIIHKFIVRYDISILMGQQEVYDFLKDHPVEWFTSKEISKGINISIGSTTVCLKKLRKNKEILYKAIGKKSGTRTQYSYCFKK